MSLYSFTWAGEVPLCWMEEIFLASSELSMEGTYLHTCMKKKERYDSEIYLGATVVGIVSLILSSSTGSSER